MKRTQLREHIFQMAFSLEFNSREDLPEQFGHYLEEIEDAKEEDIRYMKEKVMKIADKTEEIDTLINEHTKGWKTTRMNKVDLTILRVALYEMRWDDDVPVGVAIDEAVELAKKYSGEDGPAFVNGVLGKLTE